MQETIKEWEINLSMKEKSLSNPMNNRGGTWCIGNGQVASAISMSYEVSQTLNCMHDPMLILITEEDDEKV